MFKKILFVFILSISMHSLMAQENTPFTKPPEWSKQAIWYQIFVERFNNGDPTNDPKRENISIPTENTVPDNWAVTPWTMEWYGHDTWEKDKPFQETVQYRRYGGDLQGVINKLDYLQNLGVNALFINPLNDAPSLHKYDARNYHHIDVNFGPDPVGDNKIIAAENPVDPATWQWTSADKLFLQLVQEVHKRGMKIIMDYSWNHTGILFWAWQDILKNQQQSPYKDWYSINSFDDPATTQNEFSYTGWLNIPSLPEWKKVDITTPKVTGFPYEGNINSGAKKHIFDVTKRWLSPNGITANGIDGFRLDVADQIGMGFWRDFRTYVRGIQPNAYLIGEIWWESWPDHLMDPTPYTKGDVFDAVMFYQAYRPARYFFAKTNYEIDAAQFKDSLEFQWNRLIKDNRYAMMNVSSTHDAPRLLSDFYNTNKYKYNATPNSDAAYKTGKPDAEAYTRLRLYLVHLFTTVGAPQIWNGEEMGMWGGDDPHPRKPLWWKEYSFQPENRNNFQPGPAVYDKVGFNQQQFDWYKKLTAIRANNPVLSNGDIAFLTASGKMLSYKRYNGTEEIIVLFNLEKSTKTFTLPAKATYLNLLTNKTITGNSCSLSSLSGAVLKKIQ